MYVFQAGLWDEKKRTENRQTTKYVETKTKYCNKHHIRVGILNCLLLYTGSLICQLAYCHLHVIFLWFSKYQNVFFFSKFSFQIFSKSDICYRSLDCLQWIFPLSGCQNGFLFDTITNIQHTILPRCLKINIKTYIMLSWLMTLS